MTTHAPPPEGDHEDDHPDRFWSSDWRFGTGATPLSREEFEAIRQRQADDTGEHTVGTPIQQIHSDRLALLNELLRLRKAHEASAPWRYGARVWRMDTDRQRAARKLVEEAHEARLQAERTMDKAREVLAAAFDELEESQRETT